MINFNFLLPTAISLARHAGKIQMKFFHDGKLSVNTKENEYDVVTTADKEAEEFIINELSRQFPEHGILAEESGVISKEKEEFRWIIDPLDGTVNFSQGLPIFCVSIAVQYNGETVVGVVYAPYLDQLFYAVKGEGAFMNNTKLTCSSKVRLEESVVATGLPYDKRENPDNNINELSLIAPRVRGLRRFGSAALDLCYVAAGYIDGYWELNLKLWDVAAGLLIAKEAGARTFAIRENRNHSLLVACPGICDTMLELLLTPRIKHDVH